MALVADPDTERFLAAEGSVTVVAAQDRSVALRLCAVLAEHTAVRLLATALDAIHERLVACDLLVAHCPSIDSGQAALIEQLRHDHPALRIIVVCASVDGRGIRRAVDGAVDGIVLVDQLEAALAPTVAAVRAGQAVIPREASGLLRKPALSFREKQVLALVVLGLTNNEIARRLYLAESTVKSHLSSAFGKLGVSSRSEAAALILDPNGTVGAGVMKLAVASGAVRPAEGASAV